MAIYTISGTDIEHNGDVSNGLKYLEMNWNSEYVLDLFENARTSRDYKADFRIPNSSGNGFYILKYIRPHYYYLSWRD